MHAPLASTTAGRGRGAAESLTTAAVALGFVAAALWAILARRTWYDEFYTLYVASPRFPLANAITEHWLPDNHPPLFYALARATAFLGEHAAARRLLNIAVLIAAGASAWALLRGTRWGAGLALVLAAQPASLLTVSELRSYFASLAAATVLAIALALHRLDPAGDNRARRAALWLSAIAAFNLHIVTTILAAALFAPFVAAALWRRDFRAMRDLMLPAVAGTALFAAITTVQWPHWLGNTRGFWIPAGFDAARWPLEHLLVRTLTANPVVLAGALAGFALLARDAWRQRRASPALEAIALLGTGAAFGAAVLIGLHLLRPLVMEKYLVALIPAVAIGLALAFARAREALGRWLPAALAAAALWSLVAMAANARDAAAMNAWDPSAAALHAMVARCPDSAVHIDPEFANAYTLSLSPADNRAVIAFAYRQTAQHHGLRLEPSASRRVPARCPTLFWGEHDTSHRVTASALLARERRRGFAIRRLSLVRVGDGWIAADRPL